MKDLDLKLDDKNIIQDNKMLTDKHIYAAQKLLRFDFPEIIQQTTSLSNEHFYELVKNLKANKVVQIHNTGNLHWVTSTNIEDKRVFVFDSLYDVINEEILKQVDQIYSMVPLCKKIIYKQSGGVDCGLFAIAFSVDLCYGIDPNAVLYDQSRMRKHLIQCFDKMKLTQFPRFRTDPSGVKPNQSHVSWEWHLPNKIAKRNHLNGNTKHNRGIQPYNRFRSLSTNESTKTEFQNSEATRATKATRVTVRVNSKSTKIGSSQTVNNDKKLIVNLSSKNLTKHEMDLLRKGFKFCPSTKAYNKVNFVTDILKWFRNLRLREYFWSKRSTMSENESENMDTERSPLKWHIKRDGYPSNNNEVLEEYISQVTTDIEIMVQDFENLNWNNLSKNEREALDKLKRNQSIVIKIADKGGAIVVMDRSEYTELIKKDLNDTRYYTKLEHDNIQDIISEKDKLVEDMKDYLDSTEYETLSDNGNVSTPIFYGLPKIHKTFVKLPPLRPIVAGYQSATVKLSEYVDSFLKPAARKCSSYVRDTTHFLNRLRSLKSIPNDAFMVVMDVHGLYNNIDQEEGGGSLF